MSFPVKPHRRSRAYKRFPVAARIIGALLLTPLFILGLVAALFLAVFLWVDDNFLGFL